MSEAKLNFQFTDFGYYPIPRDIAEKFKDDPKGAATWAHDNDIEWVFLDTEDEKPSWDEEAFV